MDYDKQAEDFLKKTGTTFEAKYLRHGKHFPDDLATRDVYQITLSRGSRVYKFEFGRSLKDSTRYKDKVSGNIYAPDGTALKGNAKVISNHAEFFKKYCVKVAGDAPSAYDVLTCLQKYDPGTLENFCADCGYDTDSRKAERIYNAVVEEWKQVCILWTAEEVEQLQEIN
jgi:hypothetical protein